MEHLVIQIASIIVLSGFLAFLANLFKQPLIMAYIASGVILGPFVLNMIDNENLITGLSHVGVMLMLFLIGLEMNTSKLKDIGPVSLFVGVGQILFTVLFGFLVVYFTNFTLVESIYMAIMLAFSSTVVAIKIMSDKRDTNALYGQISIGILIVQDIIAVLILLVLAGFDKEHFYFDYYNFGFIMIKGTILTIITLFISSRYLSKVYAKINNSQELIVLFSIAWSFLIAIISSYIGFSMEIGSFIAGVGLANLPYTFEISSKSKIIRDFFVVIFFAAIGLNLSFLNVGNVIIMAISLSLFVMIFNPIIVMIIMGLMGYDKRTGFLTGLNIANISEFSLIVATLGTKIGHIDKNISSIVAMIAIFTMFGSTYMIYYADKIYYHIKKYLKIFEFKKQKGNKLKTDLMNHIIVMGYGKIGKQILSQIKKIDDNYLVVDSDNNVIQKLINDGYNCIHGDVEDEDFLQLLNIENAKLIISTLPVAEKNYCVLNFLKDKKRNEPPIVMTIAHTAKEGAELFLRGADYIILQSLLNAQHIKSINKEIFNFDDDDENIEISDEDIIEHIKKHQNNEHYLLKIINKINIAGLSNIKDVIGVNIIDNK